MAVDLCEMDSFQLSGDFYNVFSLAFKLPSQTREEINYKKVSSELKKRVELKVMLLRQGLSANGCHSKIIFYHQLQCLYKVFIASQVKV